MSSPINAVIWSIVEKFSTQLVSLIIGIILARLLTPRDYGVVGMLSIFIAISNVFIDSGFANALIRKQERSKNDLSTAFLFNVIMGFTLYSILFVASPLISDYFCEPILKPLVKIIGLNVLFYSFTIVQTAILTANLNIRTQTLISLSSQVPSGLIAIYLANKGYGVYALAVQSVLASFLRCILLWIVTRWYPAFLFSITSFKYLWNFGSRLLTASLIGVAFEQIYSILIGKYINTVSLGYYTKSSQLRDSVNGVTTGLVQRIALPILSMYQSDSETLCSKFRELMKMLIAFVAPFSFFLFFSSDDIIIFLWTDKWIECSFLFKLLILSAIFNPISQLSLALMQSVGRTGLLLKLELPKKMCYIIYIMIGFYFGLNGLCLAQILINITGAAINMWPTKKILSYEYKRQVYDMIFYIAISIIAFLLPSYLLRTDNVLVNILLNFVIGFLCYIFILYFSNDQVFNYCKVKILQYTSKS